ncbi:hypothetical protein [Hyphomonas sp.]|uniref:hypothetical protein n=1 Tax=Hyphomonas sp. TaxID=87 RepID=UPI0033422425
MKTAPPIIAGMMMAHRSRQASGSGPKGGCAFGLDDLMDMLGGAASGQTSGSEQGGMLGGLLNMLDADKDGSAMDDIFNMVMKSRN